MKISIIIPTLNEAANIERLIIHLHKYGGMDLHEIIVSDGGSSDSTLEIASNAGAKAVCSEKQGRALQMNLGSNHSTGDILYFVHADTLPPIEFIAEIQKAILKRKKAGCFRFRYDSDKKLLVINSYFTKFNTIFSGGGDQSLYIQKNVFNELGGFDESYVIMEDFDLVSRLRKKRFGLHIIPKEILISARKYSNNSYLRVNIANLLVFSLYKMGVKPVKLSGLYKKLLNPFCDMEKLDLKYETKKTFETDNKI
ncbi:MAG: TIGR04283 family arsenosugar biosynthesis glycosyltransferase [Bacteroidetes bacterium]|nr:TIGR04283 family arsenosugar biosynthesis glycosyltransferase [Bacteroidota bacterium]HET6243148.1 TIGR04283 family arsenosugar biosynthesis glycosyltransferase [Bacteroidia bacterium]